MKLKTLMAHSLPRLRNQRQKVDNLHSLESYSNNDVITENKYALPDNLSTPYTSYGDKLSCWQQQDAVNVNLNVLSTSEKCSSTDKRISPCCSPDGTLIRTVTDCHRDNKVSGDGDYNTLPRVRPRIRTNPWVSPRTTPTDSPVSSLRSSSISMQNKRRMSAEDRSSDQSPCSEKRDPIEVVLNQDTLNFLDDYENCNDSDAPVISREEAGYPPGEQMVFNPDMCISFEYEEMFESQIESAIGSSVEDDDVDDIGDDEVFECCSPFSHDDSSWGEYDTHIGESDRPLTSSTDSSDNLDCLSSDDLVPEDTDETLCSDNNNSSEADTSLETSGQSFGASLNSITESEENSSQSDEDLSPGVMECSFQSIDSAMGSSIYTNDGFDAEAHDSDFPIRVSAPTAHAEKVRSIDDVRFSLQEKVQRLQQQKYIVAEKVRAAQEEERMRAQEKLRFQRQITLNRKQMLLQTLYILKSKLESQSQRLQTTYDSVLQMQKTSVLERRMPKSVVCAVP